MTKKIHIPLDKIKSAATLIEPWVQKTPLIYSPLLSEKLQTNIYLKLENLQNTGAFKVRGAFNKLLNLTDTEKARGIIAVSAGNHGRAVAYAAQKLKIQSRILMPTDTLESAIQAIKSYGAEVVLCKDLQTALDEAKHHEKTGMAFIPPYDDKEIVAGQGTIGLEILESLPQVTDVLVSIGGGGLIAGIASAMKQLKSEVRIWGVETVGAPTMFRSLQENRLVHLDHMHTVAKTLCAPIVGQMNFEVAQTFIEKVELVNDEETISALKFLLEEIKLLTEPAAACTLAAAYHLRQTFTKDDHVVLLLCGGNISFSELQQLI